jgi:amidohydrolase
MSKRSVLSALVIGLVLSVPGTATAAAKPMDAKLKAAAGEIASELIAVRRDIHAHPELGFQEKRTAGIVAAWFERLGLEVRTGIGGTGVLGVLRGGKPGPVVMMRGDMDALPITEETPLTFASKASAVVDGRECGLMHACGHDIHTTLLLGTASVLARFRKDLPGTVLFVAQPAEELTDSGAAAMIADGVFRDIEPGAAFAYHVDDTLKTGFVHYALGWASANCDEFTLTIKSEGCHGADPDACVDPIVVGARIVTDLQVLIARQLDVHNDTVITVGAFHGGSASNIIPREARLKATVRTYGEDHRALVKAKIERLIRNTCAASGADYALDYRYGTPARYDDPALVGEILPTAERVLGSKDRLLQAAPEMGGEDFSYFARLMPAAMLSLGVVPKDAAGTSVHSPTFIADEDAIPLGVALMSTVIWDHQHRKPGGPK